MLSRLAPGLHTERIPLSHLTPNFMKSLSTKIPAAAMLAMIIAGFGVHSAKAVSIDLTNGGSQTLGTAIFTTTENQSTGTGVINPFLRLQGNGNETGLNSNEGNAKLLGDTKAGIWTHDITLGDLGTTTFNNTNYYIFLLDVNENDSAAGKLISLDTFQLYTRSTSITDGTKDTLAAVQAGGNKRYDMDAISDSEVLLNYSLNNGSGSGDLFVYVPTSLFSADTDSSFLYLYTQFGYKGVIGSRPNTIDYRSDAGFEEWATTKSKAQGHMVPDSGSTIALLGFGLTAAALISRRKKQA
jgi:hypothetical protein